MAAGNKQKLVIVGGAETAEIAFNYFTDDSNYEVAAFTVERAFINTQRLFGLPVVAFEELEKHYNPQEYKLFVAVSFTQLNRVRTRLYDLAKAKGYSFASYISSRAFVDPSATIGENCSIFEGTVIQHGAKVGNNVMVWSGCFIGHRTILGANCFLGAHVAVSGCCQIGENCILGVNSCTVGGIKIGKNTIIGAGAVVIADAKESSIYVGVPAKPLPNKSVESFISGEEPL
jgi:sugar O-acyltransferase (sialic acid O-acetyltransferase NeuD family)